MPDAIPTVLMKLSVDGEDLFLDAKGITPALASSLRMQSQGEWRVPTLMAAADDGIGPEELAGLLFLARRQNGDKDVTYREVQGLVPDLGEVVIEFVGAEDLDPDADPNV